MAINNVIDLDQKLDLTRNVKIAGKEYEITISDEVDKALAMLTNVDLPYQMADMERKVDLLVDKEDDELPSLESYRKFTTNEIDQSRDYALTVLDKVLGEGEGKRVYEYYNKSTKAVMTIIDLLQKQFAEVMKQRNKAAKNKYKNHNNKNKK